METSSQSTTRTRILKRVDPLSVAKIVGILYASIGLLIAPFALVMAAMSAFAGGGQETAVMIGMSLGMAILAPILYGELGFIMSFLSALLFNFIVSKVGGIQFEVE